MYLSKKTLYNRSKAEKTGSSKRPRPKCNKLFIRLDNHLRNHPICKSIPSTSLPDSEQTSHTPSLSTINSCRSYSSPSYIQQQVLSTAAGSINSCRSYSSPTYMQQQEKLKPANSQNKNRT